MDFFPTFFGKCRKPLKTQGLWDEFKLNLSVRYLLGDIFQVFLKKSIRFIRYIIYRHNVLPDLRENPMDTQLRTSLNNTAPLILTQKSLSTRSVVTPCGTRTYDNMQKYEKKCSFLGIDPPKRGIFWYNDRS